VESTGEANVLKLRIKTNQMQKMKKKRNKNKRIIKFFKKISRLYRWIYLDLRVSFYRPGKEKV
jgi:hypothetical protein